MSLDLTVELKCLDRSIFDVLTASPGLTQGGNICGMCWFKLDLNPITPSIVTLEFLALGLKAINPVTFSSSLVKLTSPSETLFTQNGAPFPEITANLGQAISDKSVHASVR